MTARGRAPEITVIIPAYNAASTIDQQLDALARQDVPFAWELLVCDNGSSDDTRARAEGWLDRIPGTRVIDASRRRGVAAARNIGAEHAQAPLIVFCDADDVVGDVWLLRMYGALQNSTAVAGSAELGLLNHPSGSSVSWHPGDVITEPYWPEFPAAAGRNIGVHAAAFHQIGGFDEELIAGEDIDFCWAIQSAGGTLTWCMDAVVHVRKRVGLRQISRQAYGYALGDKLLKHKWANPMRAYWAREAPFDGLQGQRDRSRRSVLRRLARLAQPSGRADLAWVVGSWAGRRFSTIDESLAQLPSGSSPN
jgi:glycosyltransferase involved in cell wall biosynthesis